MAGFGWFGDQEHRVFNYKPIYYDEEKEKRRQMFGKVDGSAEAERPGPRTGGAGRTEGRTERGSGGRTEGGRRGGGADGGAADRQSAWYAVLRRYGGNVPGIRQDVLRAQGGDLRENQYRV